MPGMRCCLPVIDGPSRGEMPGMSAGGVAIPRSGADMPLGGVAMAPGGADMPLGGVTMAPGGADMPLDGVAMASALLAMDDASPDPDCPALFAALPAPTRGVSLLVVTAGGAGDPGVLRCTKPLPEPG